MKDLNINFHIIISYLLPGLIGLYAISPFSQIINNLLTSKSGVPETSSLFMLFVLSLTFGMIINVFSSFTIRPIHRLLGIKPPAAADFSGLTSEKLEISKIISENTYKYFECYSNLSISLILLLLSQFLKNHVPLINEHSHAIKVVGLSIAILSLLLASFKTYRSYCVRMSELLSRGRTETERQPSQQLTKEDIMCGGGQGPAKTPKNKEVKKKSKPNKTS